MDYKFDFSPIQIYFQSCCIYIYVITRLQDFCASEFIAIYTIINKVFLVKNFPKTVQGGVIDIPSDSATQDQDVLGLDNIERDGPTAIPSQVNYR